MNSNVLSVQRFLSSPDMCSLCDRSQKTLWPFLSRPFTSAPTLRKVSTLLRVLLCNLRFHGIPVHLNIIFVICTSNFVRALTTSGGACGSHGSIGSQGSRGFHGSLGSQGSRGSPGFLPITFIVFPLLSLGIISRFSRKANSKREKRPRIRPQGSRTRPRNLKTDPLLQTR